MVQKNNPHLTSTRFGIDRNVVVLMTVLCLISIGLMAFKLSKKDKCSPFSVISSSVIAGKSTSFYTSDKVIFHADVANSDEVIWDFGDESPAATGNNVQHAYVRDAAYTVTATVNGKCDQAIRLVIKPLRKEETKALAENPISGPDNAPAGSIATFTCTTQASQCAWAILNTPIPSQTGQVASFSFAIEGTFIVELTLDGDQSKVYRKQITITPGKAAPSITPMPGQPGKPAPFNPGKMPQMPPKEDKQLTEDKKADDKPVTEEKKPESEAGPAKPKKLIVDDPTLVAYFESVVKGEIQAKDLNDFLCKEGATRVLVVSDNNRWETVATICNLFFRNKKIKKIKLTTDRVGDCIETIRMEYKKSWF